MTARHGHIPSPSASGAGPRLRVLGPVSIDAGDGPVALRGQQGIVLSLLAAAHPLAVPADTLAEELWPDRPPRTARVGLRVVVNRLRDRVEAAGGEIVHEAGAYRLVLAAADVDHRRFAETVEAARRQLVDDPARAAHAVLDALGWWRGRPYQPFESSPGLVAPAALLDEQRKVAEELLLEALLAAGASDDAAAWAVGFADAEPFRERRWELLMLALYRSGRQADALRTAQRAADTLRDELGLDPGPGLRRLEADILAQAPHLDPPAGDATSDGGATSGGDATSDGERPRGEEPGGTIHRAGLVPGSMGSPVGLPAPGGPGSVLRRPPTSYLGRDAATAALDALVGQWPLVSVVGLPGVGKTRLVAEYAASVVDRPLVWLDLVPVTAESLLDDLAGCLEIRVGQRDPVAAVADALAGAPWLLVFDNAEHLIDPVAALAEALVATVDGLTVIVTSRAPLTSPTERVLDLGPLDEADAVTLLAERSGRWPVAEADRGSLAALARQVDRLPLALELVATRLTTIPPAELVAQLSRSLSLAAGAGRSDVRHRSLTAALDWSVALLSDDDRELFSVLGVVAGRFGAPALAELTGRPVEQVRAGLGRLAGARLVQTESAGAGPSAGGAGREAPALWYQPNTVRTHARSRLEEAGTLDWWEAAHARQHVDLVRRLAPALVGPDEDRAVAQLRAVPDQLRATHEVLLRRRDIAGSAAFTLGMWEYTFFRQDYAHYHWLDDTLDLVGLDELDGLDGLDVIDGPDGRNSPAGAAELVAQAALAAWARDRFPAALALADRAEAVAAARHHPVPLAALKARFNVAVEHNDLDRAGALLGRLLAESAQRASPRHHADNLVVLSLGYTQLGLVDDARAAAARSLELAERTGNPTAVSWARVGLGSAQLSLDPALGARTLSGAASLAATVDNRWVQGMALAGMVTAHRRLGRPDTARRLLVRAVELWARAHAVGQLWRSCQEAVLLLGSDDSGPARASTARLVSLLALADRAYPLPDDDRRQLEVVMAASLAGHRYDAGGEGFVDDPDPVVDPLRLPAVLRAALTAALAEPGP